MKHTMEHLNDKDKFQKIDDEHVASLTIHSKKTPGLSRAPRRRYMPGLDGLRAIAVLAVIFYHLGFPWADGGLLGVSIFFVLSGYLITDILLAEWEAWESISLKVFWLRRARRLLPALFFTLTVLFLWLLFFRPAMLVSFKGDALAAILYVSNWWYIFHHLSYFQSYANPSLLTHFWSLAVEEQFYVIWPLFVLYALRHPKVRRFLFAITIVGAGLSAALMAVLYQPEADPSRIYYGTDTRAFSILIGAALAMVLPSKKLTCVLSRGTRILLEVAGTLALIVILSMLVFTNEYDGFIYQGGMFGLSVATAVVIAAAAHPSTWFGKVLGILPLRWLGIRSYGMYLWQYPIIILSLNNFDAGIPRLARFIVEMVLIIAVSALSFELVESPFRSGAVSRFFKNYIFSKSASVKWYILGIMSLSLIIAFAGIEVYAQSRMQRPMHAAAFQKKETGQSVSDIHHESVSKTRGQNITSEKHKTAAGAKSQPVSKSGTVNKSPSSTTKSAGEPNLSAVLQRQHVTAIGDSIMEDIKPYLSSRFRYITINAKEGRHIEEAPAIVSQMKNNGTLGNIVILELGTNGPVTINQMNSLIKQIGSKTQMIVTTTRVPRPWEDQVNQTMRQSAAAYPNVTLVDWYSASSGHPDYFEPDMVHLNQTGSQIFTNLLVNAAKSIAK